MINSLKSGDSKNPRGIKSYKREPDKSSIRNDINPIIESIAINEAWNIREVREDPNTIIAEMQRLDEVLQLHIQTVFNKWSLIEVKRYRTSKPSTINILFAKITGTKIKRLTIQSW